LELNILPSNEISSVARESGKFEPGSRAIFLDAHRTSSYDEEFSAIPHNSTSRTIRKGIQE